MKVVIFSTSCLAYLFLSYILINLMFISQYVQKNTKWYNVPDKKKKEDMYAQVESRGLTSLSLSSFSLLLLSFTHTCAHTHTHTDICMHTYNDFIPLLFSLHLFNSNKYFLSL